MTRLESFTSTCHVTIEPSRPTIWQPEQTPPLVSTISAQPEGDMLTRRVLLVWKANQYDTKACVLISRRVNDAKPQLFEPSAVFGICGVDGIADKREDSHEHENECPIL